MEVTKTDGSSRSDKLALHVYEAAELIGVSIPTMYNLINIEGFPAFKVGKRTLISYKGLAEWVERQAEKGAEL